MTETSEILEQLKEIFSEELAGMMAKFLWTYYNKLKTVGFTEEQALNLCKFPEFKR